MKIKSSHLIRFHVTGILLAWSLTSNAANIEFVSDYLRFDENTQTATLEGAVEIKTAYGYFYPSYVEYNLDTEHLIADGQLNGIMKSGERFVAKFAELDFKTQQAILIEIKALVQNEMQVAAQNLYDDDFITYAENVVASSCVVCRLRPTPIWQIRASQLLNKKDQKKIFLKHSVFEIYGFPVFYLPYLRVPSYDAERMSGILSPTLRATKEGDIGISIPYYIPISDYSDAKITTFINVGDTHFLEGSFRHNGKGYKLRVNGARSYYTGEGTVPDGYYVNGKIDANLPYEFTAAAEYTWQSDYDFQPQNDYPKSAADRINLNRTSNSAYFDIEAKKYRPTSEANIEADQYTILPNARFIYNRDMQSGFSANLDISYFKIYRELDNEIARVSVNPEINYRNVFNPGLIVSGSLGLENNIYASQISGEEGYIRSPYANFDLQLPLVKSVSNAQHILTPHLSYLWRDFDQSGDYYINLDNRYHEADYPNLFETDTYRGRDQQFSGTRTSLGLEYNYLTSSGADLAIGLGRSFVNSSIENLEVTNLNPEDQWLGYINWNWSPEWSANENFALNSEFQLTRSEFLLNQKSEYSSYSFGWVWMNEEPDLGFEDPRSEFLLKGRYQFHPNWEFAYNVNYDLLNWEAKDAILGLTYGNECIQVNFGVDFDLSAVETEGVQQEIDFSIDLFGLEKSRSKKWKKRQCKY